MSITEIIKTLNIGQHAYCETTKEGYKAVMRRCHHSKMTKTFSTKLFTAVGSVGEAVVLVRVERLS